MSDPIPPLSATIIGCTLRLGGTEYPQSVFIPGYTGEAFFLTIQSDGATLTATVSDQKAPDPAPALQGARRADVTLTYKGMTAHWTIDPFVYNPPPVPPPPAPQPGPPELKMWLSPDRQLAFLSIIGPQAHGEEDSKLTFVMIQSADPADLSYRVEWIKNPIYVDKASGRATASIVAPHHDPGNGGAMGPMGLATP
jgi:hypothetical protein